MIPLLLCVAFAADPDPAALTAGLVTVDPDVVLASGRRTAWAGGARVRIPQTYRGLPLEGRDLVLALDRAGRPVRVTGRPLARGAVEWRRVLSASDAVSRARPAMEARGTGALWAPRAAEVAWRVGDAPVRAWAVDASTASPPATFRVIVHAGTGDVLDVRPTSHAVEGNVYDPNPVVGDVSRVELAGLLGPDALSGEYADVYSCDDWFIDDRLFGVSVCEAKSRHATPDGDGDYLFQPDPASFDDPFGEVHLYHHLDFVSRWVHDRYAFAHDEPIVGVLNFPMSNAFFGDFDGDGRGDVSFGTTDDGVDFGYDADVVYHEYGHSVVDGLGSLPFLAADTLGLDWSGGGLNEGSADVLAMLLTMDPYMAEYAGSAFGDGPIRDLSTPQRCPEDLEGEVHDDGEIWASMFWAMIADPVVGDEVAADLLLAAMSTFTLDTTWNTAGQAVLDAAADLRAASVISAATHDAIAHHVSVANLVTCDRIVPLDRGATTASRLLGLGLSGDFAYMPMEKQLSIRVPADAEALHVEVSDFRTSNDALGWAMFLRRDAPVGHDVVDLAIVGVKSARPTTFDLSVEGEGDTVIVLPASELPGGPGATFYLSFASRNLGDMEPFDISWAYVRIGATPVLPEARGACACDAAGTPGPAWLLLTLLVWRRRR